MSVVSEEEEVVYDSDSDSYNCSDDDDDAAMEEDCHRHVEKHYTVLREETIKNLQENDISEVSNVLSVSRSIACTLLLHKSWKLSSIFEEWFSDEERLRTAIGIPSRKQIPSQKNYCKICMESVEIGSMLSAACDHLFCSDCWKSYVSFSINDGPGCLMLRCPEPKCKAYADVDLVNLVAAADDKQIYFKYLCRSYVELSNNRKWCPAPGCNSAVEFDVGGSDSYDVSCDCSHTFCWNCGEEAHRPVACATVAKWAKKNTSEAENTTWIMAYTKPCPKCKRNIEKNRGCQHMTCSKPCGYEFCWLCLDKWTGYGHVSTCNKYVLDDKQSASRAEMKRYSHYFERWSSNHRSRGIAAGDLARARDEHVPLLKGKLQAGLDLDLQFLVEAWEQIVECRRVLKWCYAYGFYIDEAGEEEKTFFECLKEGAETALEKLHYFAENKMRKYIESEDGLDDILEFRRQLKTLTSVTGKFFDSLVGAFENDLCEVERINLPFKKAKVEMHRYHN